MITATTKEDSNTTFKLRMAFCGFESERVAAKVIDALRIATLSRAEASLGLEALLKVRRGGRGGTGFHSFHVVKDRAALSGLYTGYFCLCFYKRRKDSAAS